MPRSLTVAVPAHRGNIHAGCTKSLLAIQRLCGERGIDFSFHWVGFADPATARNILASIFLRERADAMLMIDSDMGVGPTTVDKMLDADKPIIGAVCPTRSLDIDRLLDAAKTHDRDAAIALASHFNFERGAFQNEPIKNGLGRGERVGAAVMLVQRTALLMLAKSGSIRTNTTGTAAKYCKAPLYGFFDPITDGDSYVSEDNAFCDRWRNACQGEIWALTGEPIKHFGEFTYQATYRSVRAG